MVAQDTLNPINHGLKIFNKGEENGIYKPFKTPPKVPCGTNVRERERKKGYLVANTLTVPN